jgi:hypothetical protein
LWTKKNEAKASLEFTAYFFFFLGAAFLAAFFFVAIA